MNLSTLLRNIKTFLGSLRLTVYLIVSLGIVFLLGLWIPQKGVIDYQGYLQWKANAPNLVAFVESAGFMEIYRAPVTLALWVLFFINLALVMWQRFPVVRRRISWPDTLPDPLGSGFPLKVTMTLPDVSTAIDLSALLNGSGYRFQGSPERFYCIRNRLSPLASLLFHLSFFLMLLGGVISIYTRFVGQVDLAEGETFLGEPARYNASPQLPRIGGYPKVRIAIRKIMPLVEAGTPTGLKVLVEDDSLRTRAIDINQPYRRGIVSFVIRDLGLAPLVILRDSSGKEVDGAFIKLNVMKGREDGFRLGNKEFKVRFFPDHELVDGEDRTRTEEMRNPVLLLMALQNEKRTIYRVPCRPGYSLQLDGMTYEFSRFPFWVRFTVVSEKGVPLVYAGFLIACVGLFWRLALFRRELAGGVYRGDDGCLTLQLAFRSEFYRSLAEEEFESLQQRIVSGVAKRGVDNA